MTEGSLKNIRKHDMKDGKVSQISLITSAQNGIIRTNKKQQKMLEFTVGRTTVMAVKMLPKKMAGAILPGNSSVEMKEFDVPKPGHGQVLIQTKATTICGSDIRCIYREHVGKGPEGYIPGMVAGHEPCGVIVEEGEGLRRFKKGDRVIVYHISGCGVCNDCRRGYYISCRANSVRHTAGKETAAWLRTFWRRRRT